MRTRINVPKEDEELAKELGAKYDGRMKSFYVPKDKPISLFTPFIRLPIELVPDSAWEVNVRSEYKQQWSTIKRKAYRKANYTCEICGGKGENHPVECHEEWSYDMETKIQKLEGLVALCPKCHKTQHWGYALVNGMGDIVKSHIKKINKWKDEDVEKYVAEAFYIFELRCREKWTLDLSNLEL